MRRPQLLFIDDIPTPYRLGVHRRVATCWPGSFRLAFCADEEPGRHWRLDFGDLNPVFLPGWQWRPRRQTNPFSFKWNPTVSRFLEETEPDVVVLSGYAHPTMWQAAAWCIRHNIPYGVTCETNARATATGGVRWALRRAAIGWLIDSMSFGLPTGRAAATYLRQLGARHAPMYFYPNTPDTSLFERTVEEVKNNGHELPIRRRYGIPTNGLLFTFVGRFIKAKNPLHVVEAFNRISDGYQASLLLIGDGPQWTAIAKTVERNPRIVCSGWIENQTALAEVLAISDALVLPSSHEPWGAVVNEAMASKTCVIASDHVGAAVELVRDRIDGFVVPIGDIASLQAAMMTLIEDPVRCSRMGEAAQERALSHGASFAAENLISGGLDAIQHLREGA